MNSTRRRTATVVVMAAIAIPAVFAVVKWRASREADTRLESIRSHEQDLNVILISLDTTRADRLGCYGYDGADTPGIDAFAAEGVRFAKAKSHVPITLPSHASVFTGTTPAVHGAHHHFSGLSDEGNVTMAELLSEHGYTTAAFVAAFVLDHSLGVDQGFQHYSDQFGFEGGVGAARLERRAGDVFSDAIGWLGENEDKKIFAFVHLYDPHLPYLPPSPYDSTHSDRPYDGEIAYVDAEFRKFADYLDKSGLSENTLVVIFGDHGESLGEHGIEAHASFVYDTVTWVPLIVRCPGLIPGDRVVDVQVRLIDVLPTVLDILGIEPPPAVQGTSLLPHIQGRTEIDDLPAYVESYDLNYVFGWSPLLSVDTGRWKYIRAPGGELYDLANDPGELNNLFDSSPDRASELGELLDALLDVDGVVASEATTVELDEMMVQKLYSLGYIGGVSRSADDQTAEDSDLVDPKDSMDEYLLYQRAVVAGSYERHGEAVQALEKLYEQMPDNTAVARLLSKNLVAGGQVDAAIPVMEKLSLEFPDDVLLNVTLGLAYGQRGRLREAESVLLGVLDKGPHAPQVMSALGSVYYAMGAYDRAMEMLQGVAGLSEVDPQSHYTSLINLGTLHLTVRNEPDLAVPYFQRALRMLPSSPDAHYYLALIFAQNGERRAEAETHARAFLRHAAPRDDRRPQIESLLD